MSDFLTFIIIGLGLFIYFSIVYFEKFDTVVAYTGGLGSGKTFKSVRTSLKLLRRNRFKVRLYNLFHSKKKERPLPQLYASIPVVYREFFWSKKEFAICLTKEHLLLQKRVIPRSITFVDEIGAWANQFEYELPNLKDNFNEFIRFYRHYTLGGYFVCNDQCSENIVLYVRRRLNTVFNLMHFKKWVWLFYTVRCRNIYVSEEIKTIEDENAEDGTRLMFGFMPLFKYYDTYCYSVRYETVPYLDESRFTELKKLDVLTCPKQRAVKKTPN